MPSDSLATSLPSLTLGLVLGLVLGGLGATWYLGAAGGDPSRASADVGLGPGILAPDATSGSEALTEVGTMGERTGAAPGADVADVGATTTSHRTVEGAASTDRIGRRVAALERAFRHGDLAPEALTDLAARSLIDAGLPGEALDLLLDVGARRSWLFVSAGRGLVRGGERDRAIEAFTAALRIDPGSSSATHALADLDPLACVTALRSAMAARGLEADRDSRANLSSALEAAGLVAEAATIVQELLVAGPRDRNLLERLERMDPAAYEAHLTELVDEDPEAWVDDLAEFLDGVGRRHEALDLLGQQLLAHPGDLDWIATVEELDPERALRALTDHYPGSDSSEELAEHFASVGSALWKVGRQESALHAWSTAVQRCPIDEDGELDYAYDFYQQAPAHLARALELRRTEASTAAFHADLADVWWQAGRPEQAEASLRRAAELDPDTWQVVLDRLAGGEDPF